MTTKHKVPTPELEKGTPLLFLREKVVHSRQPDITPHVKSLEEIPAVFLFESTPWCRECHEPEQGHDRGGKRRHPFEPETGATIEVHYPADEPSEIRHHVFEGGGANCYKLVDG